ncbi:MAG: hypothetical protein DWH79_04700 [Planctomycetota bacterium]|nr:MAG: hypothetical protein DWH79_04700 [Planctomycetota bacterium]
MIDRRLGRGTLVCFEPENAPADAPGARCRSGLPSPIPNAIDPLRRVVSAPLPHRYLVHATPRRRLGDTLESNDARR